MVSTSTTSPSGCSLWDSLESKIYSYKIYVNTSHCMAYFVSAGYLNSVAKLEACKLVVSVLGKNTMEPKSSTQEADFCTTDPERVYSNVLKIPKNPP